MPRPIVQLVVHHSAGNAGTVEEFRRLHRARGFSDIGYHAVIQPNGRTDPGRSEAMDGAGVWGNNSRKLHVCLIGQFASGEKGYTGKPASEQLHALGVWLLSRGRTYQPSDPRKPVVGHKEITLPGHATACPGDLPLELIREWYRRSIHGAKVGSLDAYLNGTHAAAGPAVRVRVNGKELAPDMYRYEAPGRTFIASSALSAGGAQVEWDGKEALVVVNFDPPPGGPTV
jgi:N-acetylmuramoyl-L-alanine amidase